MYEYERRLGVFREKNSKLKYKSEGTIQTEYKEPQLPKKKKKKEKEKYRVEGSMMYKKWNKGV